MRFWWQHKEKPQPVYFTDYPESCTGCFHKRTTACPYPMGKENCNQFKVAHFDVLPDRVWRIQCPSCKSYDTTGTYGHRFECKKCGMVFH